MPKELTVIMMVDAFEMDSEQLVITTRSGKEVYLDLHDVVAVEVKP